MGLPTINPHPIAQLFCGIFLKLEILLHIFCCKTGGVRLRGFLFGYLGARKISIDIYSQMRSLYHEFKDRTFSTPLSLHHQLIIASSQAGKQKNSPGISSTNQQSTSAKGQ